MTTPHPDELLSALLDGELEPDVAAIVERHLRDCASCRRDLVGIEQARRSLREAPPVEAPAGLVSGFIARRRRADRRGASLALAAAVVAVATSLLFADPAGVHEASDREAQDARDKVERDTRPRRDNPQAIRRANDAASPDPSVAERAEEALRELLDFLG